MPIGAAISAIAVATPVITITGTAIPEAHTRPIAAAVVTVIAVAATVISRCRVVTATINRGTRVVGTAIANGSHIARIVITARQRRHSDNQDKTGEQTFHDPFPSGVTAPCCDVVLEHVLSLDAWPDGVYPPAM
jgi:hypothetical protein